MLPGSIGTALLAKADPDGYTLGVVFDTHAVNPSLIPNLPFDTTRDLTPIMLVGTGAMALVAHVNEPLQVVSRCRRGGDSEAGERLLRDRSAPAASAI